MSGVLFLLFLASLVQAQRFVDCMNITDVDSCVAVNDEVHPKRHSAHIHCMWCHSHDDSGMSSHCQSLTAIRGNPKTYRNWVCDHLYPSDTPRAHFQNDAGDDEPLTRNDPYGKSSNGKNSSGKNSSGKNKNSSGKDKNSSSSDKSKNGGSDPKNQKMTNPGIMPNTYTAYSGTVQEFVKQAPKPVQFLGGLAMGVLGMIPFQPTKIISDVDSVFNDIKSIAQNFSPKPSGYIKDITMIADTIKDAYSLLKDSGAITVAEDAAKVAAKAESPIGWLIGAGELAWNGANIYYDVKTAIQAAKTGDEFTLGKSIGSILSILAA